VSRRIAALLATLALLAPTAVLAGEDALVLIVSNASPVTHLDILELRKLYLGFEVSVANRRLHALENRSDPRLEAAFLQNVMAMSADGLEKRQLSTAMRFALPRPVVYERARELLAAVAADPAAVSVAWASEVVPERNIRVLRTLWRD
jgi:hypothetical protein